jgi:hypothetical protein
MDAAEAVPAPAPAPPTRAPAAETQAHALLRLLGGLRRLADAATAATTAPPGAGKGGVTAAPDAEERAALALALSQGAQRADWRELAALCTAPAVAWRLTAQLRDPLAAMAGAWPAWCDRLLLPQQQQQQQQQQKEAEEGAAGGAAPLLLPLLPLGPRLTLLRLAALGPSRVLHAVQEGARRMQGNRWMLACKKERDGTHAAYMDRCMLDFPRSSHSSPPSSHTHVHTHIHTQTAALSADPALASAIQAESDAIAAAAASVLRPPRAGAAGAAGGGDPYARLLASLLGAGAGGAGGGAGGQQQQQRALSLIDYANRCVYVHVPTWIAVWIRAYLPPLPSPSCC